MKPVLVMLACLALISPAGAQGQKAGGEPVDIKSDRLTIHQKEQRAVFEGNVKTVQGELRINCE